MLVKDKIVRHENNQKTTRSEMTSRQSVLTNLMKSTTSIMVTSTYTESMGDVGVIEIKSTKPSPDLTKPQTTPQNGVIKPSTGLKVSIESDKKNFESIQAVQTETFVDVSDSTPSSLLKVSSSTHSSRSKPISFTTYKISQERSKTPGKGMSNIGSEIRHLVFLKVHKCGSSTVQNIFMRFGYLRNLTFVLAHDNKSKSETNYVNVISYKQSLTEDNIVPPPEGRHYDLLCCHVIYNREQFRKYLPMDAVYIGIVREPIKRLESSIGYFKLLQNVSFSDFASQPLKYSKAFPSMINNRMAFEFGFTKDFFPSASANLHSFDNITKRIALNIDHLNKEFDFLIINERMDESLVYMKRLLRWQLKDILYLPLLGAKKERRRFTEYEANQLRDFLYLDYAVYEFAVKRFEAAIATERNNFQEEVKHFQDKNDIVKQFCQTRDSEELVIEASVWNKEFIVTRSDCKLFELFEMTFIQKIRKQQYGRLDN